MLVLVLFLGVTQVAFTLYGRNVLLSSAHEGARAAIEMARSEEEAAYLARATVERAVGGLVDDVQVDVSSSIRAGVVRYTVVARGRITALGVVSLPLHVTGLAHASRDTAP